MIALLLALFCALSLSFLGQLDQAMDMSAGILLVWGIGIFLLPRPSQNGWRLIAAAALLRLVLLPVESGMDAAMPSLLDDAAQLWMGGNPYASGTPSPFSPLKLWLMAPLQDLESVETITRFLSIAADLLVVWLLATLLHIRKRRIDGAWLYALHPLGALESAVHMSLTAPVIACALLAVLAWMRGRSGLGWASLGGLLGATPLAMIPALWKRSGWIMVLAGLTGILLLWPLSDSGGGLWDGIVRDVTKTGMPGIFALLLSWLNSSVLHALCTVTGLLILIQIWMRWRDPVDILLWSTAAWVLVAPTLGATAILWVWVPAIVCGQRAWGVLATLAPLSYLCLPSADLTLLTQANTEWIPWVVFLPFLLSFGAEFVRHQTRPGPWQAGPARNTSPSPSLT
jgi:hypothetical protein